MSGLDAWVREAFAQVELYEEDLHAYQVDSERFLYSTPFSALWQDTGMGKTPTLLRLINRLVMNDECENVLVIGPQRVVNVSWPDEIAKWQFSVPLSHTIIREDTLTEAITRAGQAARREAKVAGHGKDAANAIVKEARRKAARKAVRDMMRERLASIFLIHKEQVEFLVEAFGKDWPFDVVIIDESSSLKDHTTNRWKALWKVRPLIKRMHQLTATPAAESYLHLFAQITLLDGGERLGLNFAKYRDRYFTQNRWSMRWAPREGAIEEISAKIADICLEMKQQDYLDLQQPVTAPYKIHLDAKQTALYRKMEEDLIVELDDGTEVEAETAAALSQKLLQMASGVLYDNVLEPIPGATGEDDEPLFRKRRVVHNLHDHKIDQLAQIVEETEGECLLVSYYHQASLDRLMKAFPQAKPMDKEGKCIKEWNKGKIPMLLIHPQSDAHGLNLQKGGRHVVFFDIPWSYENYYQLYRRLARQGQQFLVVIHQLIAAGTIDELVVEALNNKRDGQEVLFKLIRKLRRRILAKKRQAEQQLEFTDL